MRVLKSAILGGLLMTALLFAGAAQAQTNTITGGTTTLLSTNNDTVTSTGTFSSTATIADGLGNRIGTSSAGASSSATIDQSLTGSTSALLGALPSNSVAVASVTANNDGGGVISSTSTFTGAATITAGTANAISVQAIGASAAVGITARYSAP